MRRRGGVGLRQRKVHADFSSGVVELTGDLRIGDLFHIQCSGVGPQEASELLLNIVASGARLDQVVIDTFKLVGDIFLKCDDARGVRVVLLEQGIERGRDAGVGAAGNDDDVAALARHRFDRFELAGFEAQVLERDVAGRFGIDEDFQLHTACRTRSLHFELAFTLSIQADLELAGLHSATLFNIKARAFFQVIEKLNGLGRLGCLAGITHTIDLHAILGFFGIDAEFKKLGITWQRKIQEVIELMKMVIARVLRAGHGQRVAGFIKKRERGFSLLAGLLAVAQPLLKGVEREGIPLIFGHLRVSVKRIAHDTARQDQ